MLTNRGTSGDPGQYIIGLFVANSTEQSFTLTGSVSVNAYQLRAIPAPPVAGYDTWAGSPDGYGLTGGAADRSADPDGDGFTNIQEFLFGTSPIVGNGTLVTSEKVGGDLVLHWLQRASGSGYLLQESITMGASDWNPSTIVPALDDQGGVPTAMSATRRPSPLASHMSSSAWKAQRTDHPATGCLNLVPASGGGGAGRGL